MNSEFKQGRNEFKQKNYNKALKHFNKIKKNDEDYEYALPYKISCLMKLKRYDDALKYLDSAIAKNPYDDLFWFDKALCHVLLNEDSKAFEALNHLERLVDSGDKTRLLKIAKLYNLLNDSSKVIEYCDKALEIDKNYMDALYEKSLAVLDNDDSDTIGEISDKLLEISDMKLISLIPVFLLKLLSKDYRGSLDVLDRAVDDDLGEDTIEMFKFAVFNQMSEDLGAKILLTQKIDISVDEALEILFDFKEYGKDYGKIYGISYFIL